MERSKVKTILALLVCLIARKEATAAISSPQVVIKGLPHIVCTSGLGYYVDPSGKLSFKDMKNEVFSDRTSGLLSEIDKYGSHAH
jgi:hypothetical protein